MPFGTYRGLFDPSTESRPSITYGGENLDPESDYENTGSARATHVSGGFSLSVVTNNTDSPTGNSVELLPSGGSGNPNTWKITYTGLLTDKSYRWGAYLAVEEDVWDGTGSNPQVDIWIEWDDGSSSPKRRVVLYNEFLWLDNVVKIGPSATETTLHVFIEIQPAGSPTWGGSSSDGMYIDGLMLWDSVEADLEWEPTQTSDYWFPEGDWWEVSAPGSFDGLALNSGDIIEVVSEGFQIYAPVLQNARFAIAQHGVDPLETLIRSKPAAGHGLAMGYGDWRFAVEIALPSEEGSQWGGMTWGSSYWAELEWQDITAWVRGCSWRRGTSTWNGRPETGVLDLTLENLDREWSPWNPVTSFRDSVMLGENDEVLPGFLGAGTLVRVVCHSPSGMIDPIGDPGTLDPTSEHSWVQQITAEVESWDDETSARGIDGLAQVTAIETISRLAKVDENELDRVVGTGEYPNQRINRLLDAANWPYGNVNELYSAFTVDGATQKLQSTLMGLNRLAEVFLTADSTALSVQCGRDGRIELRNLFAAIDGPRRGPDRALAERAVHGASAAEGFEYVADSEGLKNDESVINNVVRMSKVGGTQYEFISEASIARYGRRPYERFDLICKDNAMANYVAYLYFVDRVIKNPIRLRQLSVHGLHPNTYPALIGLDVRDKIDAVLPALGGKETEVRGAAIDSMTHTVTPRRGGADGVVWRCDYTFGVADSLKLVDAGSPPETGGTVLFEDNFNRADGSLGSDWGGTYDSYWSISGNAATQSEAYQLGIETTSNMGQADVDAVVDVSDIAGDPVMWIRTDTAARFNGASGVGYSVGVASGEFRVYAGATLLYNVATSGVTACQLRLKALGSTILAELIVGGSVLYSWTGTNATYPGSAGASQHVALSGDSDTTFDNLTVTAAV